MFYTAIVGDRDYPRSDILTFTDEVVPNDPIRSSKRYKCLPHEYLDWGITIWVDGRIFPKLGAGGFLVQMLEGFDVVLFRHPRKTLERQLKREYDLILRGSGHEKALHITKQVYRYCNKGFSLSEGIWVGGIVIRRNNPRVKVLGEIWWNEIQYGSVRDQLSLPYAVKLSGVAVRTLDSKLVSNYFQFKSHRYKFPSRVVPPKRIR